MNSISGRFEALTPRLVTAKYGTTYSSINAWASCFPFAVCCGFPPGFDIIVCVLLPFCVRRVLFWGVTGYVSGKRLEYKS